MKHSITAKLKSQCHAKLIMKSVEDATGTSTASVGWETKVLKSVSDLREKRDFIITDIYD